jgi:hypothetical protein
MLTGDVNWKDTALGKAITDHFTQSLAGSEQTEWLKEMDATIAGAKNFLTGTEKNSFGDAATDIDEIYGELLNQWTD